jgi:hypothetical protein
MRTAEGTVTALAERQLSTPGLVARHRSRDRNDVFPHVRARIVNTQTRAPHTFERPLVQPTATRYATPDRRDHLLKPADDGPLDTHVLEQANRSARPKHSTGFRERAAAKA